MAATAFNGFVDALASALVLRAGLSGVRVFTCPVDPGDLGKEAIELGAEVGIEQEPAAMSSTHIEETFDVPGSIMCFASMPTGATTPATINAAAKSCRDRALAILEELTDSFAADGTMSGSVRDAQISSITVHQGMAPEGQLGRVCWVEFTISAEAHTTP